MILLAFLILILSAAVVYILWGKFEEEIARLRGAAGAAAHSTSLHTARCWARPFAWASRT